LHILRQRKEGWSAIGGIQHGGDGGGQGLDELRGMRDSIPIAGDRPERIVHRDGGVAEVFNLLEDRMGQAVVIVVAGQKKHRQAVGVRHRSRGNHVGGTGPNRRGRRADSAASVRLGVCGRRKGHRLLILSSPCGQLVTRLVERFAQADDITVAENRKDAAEQRLLSVVDDDALRHQVLDERLRHGEA
jgi:hypothetical protein